ncbi:MAG: NUDIX domain-containing protein [Candidatus Aenigmatarchaeota archaeon]
MKEFSARAAGVVVNEKKQICLILEHGRYQLPGGSVDDETIENAAEREIFEDTGLKLKPIKKLGVVVRPSSAKQNVIRKVHLFLFRANSEKIIEKEKGHIPLWIAFEDAVNKLISREEKIFLLKHRNEILK